MIPKMLSVVVPMYNEAGNVDELFKELVPIVESLSYFTSYEVIAVDDGSRDDTCSLLKKNAQKNKNIKVVSFMRNFGHEYATYAGLEHAHGEAIVVIDADRQDPARLIHDFVREYANGYDIVYGQRAKRLNETWLKKVTSMLFYPLFKYLTHVDIPSNVGDFCLLNHKVVDQMMAMPEKKVFIRGLIYWSGFSKKAIPFVRQKRGAGKSNYNYRKLTIFALENIISFSTVPIYVILFLSLGIISMCFVGALAAFTMRSLGYVVMVGWTSLIISMLFLFSCLLFCMGIIGLYVGKIFQEIKGRPRYLVREYVNFAYEKKTVKKNKKIHLERMGARGL